MKTKKSLKKKTHSVENDGLKQPKNQVAKQRKTKNKPSIYDNYDDEEEFDLNESYGY